MAREVAYRALADQLRAEIQAGAYEGGRPLPTEEQLAASHAVSRSTVRRAMQDLVAEGAVYRMAGKGTYPLAAADRYLPGGTVEDAVSFPPDGPRESEILSGLETKIDVDAAARLRLTSDAVVTLSLRRLTQGVSYSVAHAAFPLPIGRLLDDGDLAKLTSRDSQLSIAAVVDLHLTKPIMYTEQTVSAVPLPPALAPHLDSPEGVACLRFDRLHSDIDGQPILFTTNYFNPSLFTYRLRFKRATGLRPHR